MSTPSDSIRPSGAPFKESPVQTGITRILVVDKPRFAQLIRRMLSVHFDVVCVDDVAQGVETFHRCHPDVVVAELGASGGGLRLAELLDMNVKGRHTPFILTCIKPQADLVERARAVGVDALLVKPFAPSALLERLGAVFKGTVSVEDQEDRRRTLEILKAHSRWIDGLPPFPDTYQEFRKLASVEKTLSRDFDEKVQMEPYLMDSVLKLAEAHPEVFPHRMSSLHQAASQGGIDEVANLVMIRQVFELLGAYRSSLGLDLSAFWKHSVGTAFVARTVAKKVKVKPDISFMTGFLHDVGKLVLDRFFSDFFKVARDTMAADGVHSTVAELQVLGTSHSHIGGCLALNWQFPEDFTEAIVCHHNPAEARQFPKLASVVHVANTICNHLSFGSSGERVHQALDDPALYKSLLKLGVGPHVLEQLTELGQGQLKRAERFWEVLVENSVLQ